jgi:hypothetical protein
LLPAYGKPLWGAVSTSTPYLAALFELDEPADEPGDAELNALM